MPEIPEPILDEIKSRIDLADLVSEHVALKRAGRGFVGLCPFHQEKTPSFNVNPEQGFFHCFGCNVGGNAFTFLMRISGVTFPEAVRNLAARVGVEVPESRRREGLDRLYEGNQLAAELFRVYLREGSRGERGREYLAQRGIDEETATRFELGYAPADGWVEKLRSRGVGEGELKKLGLASQSRRGPGLFPLFRDRIIFPIRDLSGRVIAFGGRALSDGGGPKYLNSPETPVYRKGHHLYGMDVAREAVRNEGRVLLVEGYMDAIALAQSGIGNVAAVLGTALTADQLRLARRFSDEIIVCFDGDEAGRRAALRAFPICIDDVDIWPRAVFLPAGDDPDSLVRRGGREALDDLIASSTTLVDFYLDDLVGPESGVAETARAAKKMADLLAGVKDAIVRDKLLRGASGRLGVSEDALLASARDAWRAARRRAPREAPSEPRSEPRRPTAPLSPELELVELMVCHPAMSERVRESGVLGQFRDEGTRLLAEAVLGRLEERGGIDPAEHLGDLPPAMAERIVHRLREGIDQEAVGIAADEWFDRWRAGAAKLGRKELIARLRSAEARGNQEEAALALEALRADHLSQAATADPEAEPQRAPDPEPAPGPDPERESEDGLPEESHEF